LATPATFEGELFASVVARFATGVQVHQRTAPGLVELIEQGQLRAAQTKSLIAETVKPMMEAGIDTLVLGCTHYPFIVPVLQEILGPQVRVIDPAPAIARQTRRVLVERGLSAQPVSVSSSRYFTSGDPVKLADAIQLLIGEVSEPQAVRWQQGRLPAPSEH
jgi:glutamate racemase